MTPDESEYGVTVRIPTGRVLEVRTSRDSMEGKVLYVDASGKPRALRGRVEYEEGYVVVYRRGPAEEEVG